MNKRKQKRRIKLVNKKRFVTVIMTCLVVLFATVSVISSAASINTSPSYTNFIVHRGDTLWSIASKYVPEDMDIREYINEIEKANPISNSFIAAGQELKLPNLD